MKSKERFNVEIHNKENLVSFLDSLFKIGFYVKLYTGKRLNLVDATEFSDFKGIQYPIFIRFNSSDCRLNINGLSYNDKNPTYSLEYFTENILPEFYV